MRQSGPDAGRGSRAIRVRRKATAVHVRALAERLAALARQGVLKRQACETLLSTQAPVALKFLSALNRGLTEALRTADRRLMQLNDDYREGDVWHGAPTVAP